MYQNKANHSILTCKYQATNPTTNPSHLQEPTSSTISESSSQNQTPNNTSETEFKAKKVTFSPDVNNDYLVRYTNDKRSFGNLSTNDYIIPGTIFFDYSIEEPKLIRLTLAVITNMTCEQEFLIKEGLKLQDIIKVNNVCKFHFKKNQKRFKILKGAKNKTIGNVALNQSNTSTQFDSPTIERQFVESTCNIYTLLHFNHTPSTIAGKLPYLKIKLGDLSKNPIDCFSLEDCGASHSFLSYDRFKQIEDFRQYIIERRSISVKTGKGIIKSPSAIVAKIPLTMANSTGSCFTIKKNFIVLEELVDAAYLGSDFIFDTNIFEAATIDGLIFKHIDGSTSLIPVTWQENTKRIEMLAKETKSVAPNSTILLNTMASVIPMNDKNLIIHGNDCDSDYNADYNNELVIHSMITDKSPNNTYQVLISNNSDEYLEFCENYPIATMQQENNNMSVYSIHHLSAIDDSNTYTFDDEHDFTSNLVIRSVSDKESNTDEYDEQCLFFHKATKTTTINPSNESICGKTNCCECCISINSNSGKHHNDPQGVSNCCAAFKEKIAGSTPEFFINEYTNNSYAKLNHSELGPPDASHPEHMSSRNLNEVSNKSIAHQRQKAIGEFKQRISSEENMNEDEKEKALEQFLKEGYATKSCTSVIESNTHVTELKESSEILTEQEILAKIKLDHLQPDEKVKALALFKKYISVFAKHEYDCPPNSLGVEADVQLAEDFSPSKTVNCKYFPIPPQIRPQVKNILRKMQENGLITDCTEYSPIVSNLLIGKKKSINGVIKARILVDCRAVNFFSRRLPTMLTNTQEIFSNFSKKTHISSCDINNAFFTIPIKTEKSALFTFFDENKRRKKFLRQPQGAKNSSAYMEILTSKLLEPLQNTCAYVDDLYVSTTGTGATGFQTHLDEMENLLERLQQANLKLKAEKLHFHQEVIDILGYMWSKGSFSIPEFRIQSIRDYPKPRTPKQCKRLVSFLSYFRRFIHKFAEVSAPINELAKLTQAQFKWTEENQTDFNRLIEQSCNSVKLASPLYDRKFYAASDASLIASSFCLWQLDDNGQVFYLGCSSRIFTKTERAASSFQRETISLLQGITSYEFYLKFAECICVFTDCVSILWWKSCKASNSLLMRLALILSNYEVEIKHVKGGDSWICDIVSRYFEKKETDLDLQNSLTVNQANELFKLVTLPNGYFVDKETLKKYLTMPGLINPFEKKNKVKKSTKIVITPTTFKQQKKGRKKFHPPPTTKFHPYYKDQKAQSKTNLVDFTKPSLNVMQTNNSINPPNNSISSQLLTQNLTSHPKIPITMDPEIDQFFESLNVIRLVSQEPTLDSMSTKSVADDLEANDLETLKLNCSVIRDGTITLNLLRESQLMDPLISEIKNTTPLPPNYIIRSGILIFNKNGIEKIVLAKSLLPVILHRYHFSYHGWHMNTRKTIESINLLYYHPKLSELIQQNLSGCLLCLTQKPMNKKPMILGKMETAQFPRQIWSMDLLFGFTPVKGFVGMAIFVDVFSLFTVIIPIKTKTAEELLHIFRTRIYSVFGVCQFYSDCESGIKSGVFQKFCEDRNINTPSTAPKSPWQNSNSEVRVNLLKTAIRIFTKQNSLNWLETIPEINLALNRRLMNTSKTSEEIFFGNKLPNLELLETTIDFNDIESYMKYFESHVKKVREDHMSKRNILSDRARTWANKKRRIVEFNENDIVYLLDSQIAEDTGGSTKAKFIGPFIIEEIFPHTNVCRLQSLIDNRYRMAHLTHLKPSVGPITTVPAPAEFNAKGLLNIRKDQTQTVPTTIDSVRQSSRIKDRQKQGNSDNTKENPYSKKYNN